MGEPLWLSGKVVKNEKINEIERTRVRSPPRATSLKNIHKTCEEKTWGEFLECTLQSTGAKYIGTCFYSIIEIN
jgi:hypothetical protein